MEALARINECKTWMKKIKTEMNKLLSDSRDVSMYDYNLRFAKFYEEKKELSEKEKNHYFKVSVEMEVLKDIPEVQTYLLLEKLYNLLKEEIECIEDYKKSIDEPNKDYSKSRNLLLEIFDELSSLNRDSFTEIFFKTH